MADMLVSLLSLPDDSAEVNRLREEDGILIRRVQPYEISLLRQFAREHFSETWADEILNAFTHQPVTCFIATQQRRIIGFAAYECTRRDYFGPTGVNPDYRGKGVGKALFLACLRGMFEMGYAYAIVGGVGPAEFYAKSAGAIAIPDSTPGVYVDLLERPPKAG